MKKIILLCCLFLTPFFGIGQTDSLAPPEAYFSAIIVNELESSIRWYTDNFGFNILNKVVSVEKGFKQANLKCGNILIELIELDSSLTPKKLLENHPPKTKIDGFFKFGLIVTDFDQWVAHLKKAKVAVYGDIVTDQLSNKRMLIINDPDGNRIQLFEK